MTRMRDAARQSGFVLVLTLVLVLLAGVALAGMARRSMESALAAEQAARALKRRWAVETMRSTLLPRASGILDRAERGAAAQRERPPETPYETGSRQYANFPMKRLKLSCTLAGLDYTVIVTDEQAKLNANTLLPNRTRGEAQGELERFLTQGASLDRLPRGTSVRLRPIVGSPVSDSPANEGAENANDAGTGGAALDAKVIGYDQLFDGATPAQLSGHPQGPGLAARVTCWGDGRVNIRRASPRTIRWVARGAVEPAILERVLTEKRENPYQSLRQMLGELRQISEADRRAARDVLTSRSSAHGLWVIAAGEQRRWSTFAVRAAGDSGGEQRYRFGW